MKVKDIRLKVIPSKIANNFIKQHHYSGKVVQNSKLHFGAYLNGVLHGVMSYGNPIDKRKVIHLVKTDNKSINNKWNEMLELNRMAFDNVLPKNSESRCISISHKLIKKQAPHIKWILSFADATQCGDGTIYRASGFSLVKINKNSTIYKLKTGEVSAKHGTSKKDFNGAKKLDGFQLCYIYLISEDSTINNEVPFSKIKDLGISMYKGKKLCLAGVKKTHPAIQQEDRGAIPTARL